jgi:phosphatidyl-myo-inositol dimannoside synthase
VVRRATVRLAVGEGQAAAQSALLLTPSRGLGGGIERVGASVQAAWPGDVIRVDLRRPSDGRRGSRARFAGNAVGVALRRQLAWVCCMHVGLLPVAYVASRIARCRLLLVAHGREVFGEPTHATRWLALRTDRIVAVSQFTADVVAARVGAARPDVIHLPLARSMMAAASGGRPAKPEPHTLLSVGRIAEDTHYKGWHDVALAVASLRAEYPQLRWQVVGDGTGLAALRARCEALGLADSVDFKQGISDRALADLYRRAYVFVLPSVADPDARPPIGEGFGLVYAEAGAFAVPSVGSERGGGALDFVRHGETGLTVPPRSSDALAASISWLLRNRGERDRLGEAARALALTEHSEDQFARRLRSLLTLRASC